MKRSIGIVSLLAVLAVVIPILSHSQAQTKTDKLSKKQLLSLIETAKTPADHTRLAQYYDAQAQSYLAQAQQHHDQAAAYKKNPLLSSEKSMRGTVDHCEYFAKSFKDMAKQMQELANMHEQMAKDSGGK